MIKHYVCFFRSANRLSGFILNWYPKNAYSVVGCETMAQALAQSAKDRELFGNHGWIID